MERNGSSFFSPLMRKFISLFYYSHQRSYFADYRANHKQNRTPVMSEAMILKSGHVINKREV